MQPHFHGHAKEVRACPLQELLEVVSFHQQLAGHVSTRHPKEYARLPGAHSVPIIKNRSIAAPIGAVAKQTGEARRTLRRTLLNASCRRAPMVAPIRYDDQLAESSATVIIVTPGN